MKEASVTRRILIFFLSLLKLTLVSPLDVIINLAFRVPVSLDFIAGAFANASWKFSDYLALRKEQIETFDDREQVRMFKAQMSFKGNQWKETMCLNQLIGRDY